MVERLFFFMCMDNDNIAADSFGLCAFFFSLPCSWRLTFVDMEKGWDMI